MFVLYLDKYIIVSQLFKNTSTIYSDVFLEHLQSINYDKEQNACKFRFCTAEIIVIFYNTTFINYNKLVISWQESN